MADCTNGYEWGAEIEVCVDGEVGNGNTATLRVFIVSISATNAFPSDPEPVGMVPNWDGSAVEFDAWADNEWLECDVVSAVIRVELVGDNTVKVVVRIDLSCDNELDTGYEDCGDDTEPFFEDMFTQPLTLGADCDSD